MEDDKTEEQGILANSIPADRRRSARRITREEQQGRITKNITGMIKELVLLTDGVDRLYGWTVAGAKQPASGVRVTIKGDTVFINIHIVAAFGKSIPEIARQIQNEAVLSFRREFPGIFLSAINVFVDGIRFSDASYIYRKQAVENWE